MARRSGRGPLVAASIVACVLLFAAFHSSGGKSTADWRSGSFLHAGSSREYLTARLKHSEKLWKESVEGRKTMLDYFEQSGKQYSFPRAYVAPYNLWDFVYPAFNCPYDLERVGRVGDGGKWVCGMTRYESNKDRPCILYSFGVSDDSSFEDSMLGRTNCEVWGYDFTVSGWAKQMNNSFANRAHFAQAGISNVTDTTRSPPFYSVSDIMRMNGHTYIDIMKMDIEGSEFDALGAFVRDFSTLDALPIGQLLLEIHIQEVQKDDPFTRPQSLRSWVAFWESLEAKGLREFMVEPNLLGNFWYQSPVFSEVSLINVVDKRNLLLNL